MASKAPEKPSRRTQVERSHAMRGNGLGLLLGIGLNPEMVAAPEGKTIASVVVEALRQEGLLSVPAGPETVRLLPPLNVSEEEIQQALAIIRRVLKTYAK